jgi:hypothetical protein
MPMRFPVDAIASAKRATAGPSSALMAAGAKLDAAFSPALRHARLKNRVAAAIHSGPGDLQVRARYRRFVEQHPVADLDMAIMLIERLRRDELARRAALANFGCCRRARLSLMILDELHLILRLLRRRGRLRYAQILHALLGGATRIATAQSSISTTRNRAGENVRPGARRSHRARRASEDPQPTPDLNPILTGDF